MRWAKWDEKCHKVSNVQYTFAFEKTALNIQQLFIYYYNFFCKTLMNTLLLLQTTASVNFYIVSSSIEYIPCNMQELCIFLWQQWLPPKKPGKPSSLCIKMASHAATNFAPKRTIYWNFQNFKEPHQLDQPLKFIYFSEVGEICFLHSVECARIAGLSSSRICRPLFVWHNSKYQ